VPDPLSRDIVGGGEKREGRQWTDRLSVRANRFREDRLSRDIGRVMGPSARSQVDAVTGRWRHNSP